MKKFSFKSYVAGLLTMTFLFSSTVVFAETQQSISAIFGRIKLVVNGSQVDKETLLYNGTTYVPLRAAAEALGKEVAYDNTTQTAYIDEVGTNRKFDNKYTEEPVNKSTVETPVKTNGIGAPGEGVSLRSYETVIPGGFCFQTNSADRVEVSWIAKNNTGKAIKYYHLNFAMYNAVGDPAYCTIKKEYKITSSTVGPVEPRADLLAFNDPLGYTAVCSKIVLESIDLEYMDGTKEHIEYWQETTKQK